MKTSQQLMIVGAIIVLAGFYFLGRTTPNASNTEVKHQHQEVQKFDIEAFEKQAYTNLEPAQADIPKQLLATNTYQSLDSLSGFWAKAKQASLSGKYKAAAANLENTEKSLTFAAQYLIDLYNKEQDTLQRVYQAGLASEVLTKLIAKDTNNENAKVALAQSYIDGAGETMKGVFMLRDIATKNPKNLQAGITLGRMAIQSGQFDKAITRLDNLSKIYPENSEILYHLAEAYKSQGNTAKAKELLNKCKLIVKNPNFSKEIDDYIKTF
jgi:predicted Zn-dependent protease